MLERLLRTLSGRAGGPSRSRGLHAAPFLELGLLLSEALGGLGTVPRIRLNSHMPVAVCRLGTHGHQGEDLRRCEAILELGA